MTDVLFNTQSPIAYAITGTLRNVERSQGTNGPYYTGTITNRTSHIARFSKTLTVRLGRGIFYTGTITTRPVDVSFKIDAKTYDAFVANIHSIDDIGPLVFSGAYDNTQSFVVRSIRRKLSLADIKAAKAARAKTVSTSA